MSKKFIGFWNVSVILTYIELCIAIGCICMAADGYLWQPAVGLVLCGICDMFDGKIARATKRCEDAKVFGIQIDSLCDLVSFGVLAGPASDAETYRHTIEAIDEKKAKELEEKLRANKFTLQDFYDQMVQIRNMGGMQEMLSMMPISPSSIHKAVPP